MVLMSTVNGKELNTQEWKQSLFLCYCVDPQDPPSFCNGYGVNFYVSHTIECKKSGLVSTYHINLRDEVAYLARKVF